MKNNRINENDFFMSTFSQFKKVEMLNRKPDYISYKKVWDDYIDSEIISSQYWYTEEGVYRKSDHWGRVASCLWTLGDDTLSSDEKTGFSYWGCFERIIQSYDSSNKENIDSFIYHIKDKRIMADVYKMIGDNRSYEYFYNHIFYKREKRKEKRKERKNISIGKKIIKNSLTISNLSKLLNKKIFMVTGSRAKDVVTNNIKMLVFDTEKQANKVIKKYNTLCVVERVIKDPEAILWSYQDCLYGCQNPIIKYAIKDDFYRILELRSGSHKEEYQQK